MSMPFLTDTTWPAGLRRIFDISRRELQPLENRYYGPYNKLLQSCFGPDSFDFFVAPQVPPNEFFYRDAIDFVVYLIVFDAHHRPVLMTDIKDDAWTNKADLRLKADAQIHQGYDAIVAACPLPRLWALSLLGTSLRVYAGNVVTGDIEPPFINRPSPSCVLPCDFLEGAWNIDILSQEGFIRMREVVEDIIANTAALDLA